MQSVPLKLLQTLTRPNELSKGFVRRRACPDGCRTTSHRPKSDAKCEALGVQAKPIQFQSKVQDPFGTMQSRWLHVFSMIHCVARRAMDIFFLIVFLKSGPRCRTIRGRSCKSRRPRPFRLLQQTQWQSSQMHGRRPT